MDINMRMKFRRLFLILALVCGVSLVFNGCGEQKTYRVGILSGFDYFATTADGFKEKMTELGYIEGKNISYDIRKTNIDPVKEEFILKEFVANKVDLILTFPTEVSVAAKAAIHGTNIPLVFANAFIEGVDLVKSVREPGGNITGVRFPAPDLALRVFEIMRELVPNAKRFWLAYQRNTPYVPCQLEILRPAAVAVGVRLLEVPASNKAEIEADLRARPKGGDTGMDAMMMIAEGLATSPEIFVVLGKFAVEHKIPIGGALMSVDGYESIFGGAPDNIAVGKQAALLADKIFKGTPAGTIPVISAESILTINYKAAQKIGLNISEELLAQAAQVIR
ncbi:MAG TPA: ABC transporter substrate-binding protein [Bacillota bacterium]|nr:ABC transporter substrate-binding protein [Bacillota bacterium]